MKVYSIQNKQAWDLAQQRGYLEGNENFIYEGFKKAYNWMIIQLKQRLKNYDSYYPIWIWIIRPDLRSKGYLLKDEKGVLLEININENDVLLSDFNGWHCVLNNWYLALTEKEDNLMNSKNYKEMTKEQSWKRIFDLELLKNSEYWGGEQYIQGVTGRIMLDNIKVIKEFKGK